MIMAVVGVFSSAHADVLFVDDDNCPGPGSGTVGDPYCSIQTAIDNAVDTDEIVVAPGTYFETIDFLGKAITLRSSGGPDVTTIDAGGFGGLGTVVTCESGEGANTVLEGLTITGGLDFGGGGMNNDGTSPTVIGCIFSYNIAVNGGGMRNVGGTPTVIDCTFDENYAIKNKAGLAAGCTTRTAVQP